jgi:hypothetical protein
VAPCRSPGCSSWGSGPASFKIGLPTIPSWDFLPSALPTRFAWPTGCVAPCTPASAIAGRSPITTMSPTTSMPCGWTCTWCIPAAISHVIRTCLQHRSFNSHKKGGHSAPVVRARRKDFARLKLVSALRYCTAVKALIRPWPENASAPGFRMSSALCWRIARNCAGCMWPYLPTIRAATPETCGVAIEVPIAKK